MEAPRQLSPRSTTARCTPVRCVLLHLRSGENNSSARRTFLGKSFDRFFWVEDCPMPQLEDDEASYSVAPPIVATVELQSVSWTGQLSSSVCCLHLEE
jgi:hypothetical protein